MFLFFLLEWDGRRTDRDRNKSESAEKYRLKALKMILKSFIEFDSFCSIIKWDWPCWTLTCFHCSHPSFKGAHVLRQKLWIKAIFIWIWIIVNSLPSPLPIVWRPWPWPLWPASYSRPSAAAHLSTSFQTLHKLAPTRSSGHATLWIIQ